MRAKEHGASEETLKLQAKELIDDDDILAATMAARTKHGAEVRTGLYKILFYFEASKGFALTWYRALTWYSSPARSFAPPDDPRLVTGQQGRPSPAC